MAEYKLPSRALVFGDSLTAVSTVNNASVKAYTGLSWLSWLNRLRGQPLYFDTALNKGVGGNTTEQMLARLTSDVLAFEGDFDIAFVMGGFNDITHPYINTVANLQAICEMLFNRGKSVALFTILPENNAANQAYYSRINQALRNWYSCFSPSALLFLVDCWRDTINDPLSECQPPVCGATGCIRLRLARTG